MIMNEELMKRRIFNKALLTIPFLGFSKLEAKEPDFVPHNLTIELGFPELSRVPIQYIKDTVILCNRRNRNNDILWVNKKSIELPKNYSCYNPIMSIHFLEPKVESVYFIIGNIDVMYKEATRLYGNKIIYKNLGWNSDGSIKVLA